MLNKNRKITVLLSGGHAGSTALAFVQCLNGDKNVGSIHFIGVKNAIEGSKSQTFESRVLPKNGVLFHNLIAGRVQRVFSFWTIPSLLKIPFGFIHAFRLVRDIRPSVLVSFGGFAAYPVVFSCWLCKIPIIVHEQTAAAGRANRLSSFFASKIAISRISSKKYFPEKKCVLVGNPISKTIIGIKPKINMSKIPHIFITGGSRGSVPINTAINSVLDKLLTQYEVTHQVGSNEYKKYLEIKSNLRHDLKDKYRVYDVVDMSSIYKNADIVISRAGANTVSELIYLKIPTIFIPLPFTYEDEQMENARYAKEFGIGYILPQEDITPHKLLLLIGEIVKKWTSTKKALEDKVSPDINASKNLWILTKSVVKTIL